jgi:two-component system, LytTR family, sensor kinase
MRMVFLRLGWLEMKLGPLVPRILIASLICSVFISAGTKVVAIAIDPNELENTSFLGLLINVLAMLVQVLFWNAIYFTFHFFQKSRKQELSNISLEASRNEIELKNLRSQLNPHFLFNSLNSIRALIEIEPGKAKDAVTTLSNLLRSSLILGKENLASLGDELDMVANYLDLEKIRFEERLNVKWNTDATLNDFQVPPFILQMLAENAIKHGISNLINGGDILIETKKEGESLIIRVVNSGELTGRTDTGIGIQNTRRRLDLQFKGTVDFELKQENNNVIAQLTFKL